MPKKRKQYPLARSAPDLVERDFSAEGPDQLWVVDITLRAGRGRMALPSRRR